MDLDRLLPHHVLYWAPSESDGFGQRAVPSRACLLRGRWEPGVHVIKDQEGREQVASVILYLTTPICTQGIVELSDAGAELNVHPTVGGAVEILHVGAVPPLHPGGPTHYKAWAGARSSTR